MQRSSKIGLLLSVSALLSALTLGIGQSSASQGNRRSASSLETKPEYKVDKVEQSTYMTYPVTFTTREEKIKLFYQAADFYERVLKERKSGPGRRLWLEASWGGLND